jgi:phosphoribosylaminoimidazolecarboxamide formyltransferase/IMP cyclohydrolase
MSINTVEKIDAGVKIRRVLVSVSDKSGLAVFIPGLVRSNPELQIFSTGGTFARIRKILGADAERCLQAVADYTGQPETQGGLVKTLDFKIYLGLLTETYNDDHQDDLKRTAAVPIDMVVVNLYPFKQTIAQAGVTVEGARGQIDIGGPCMIRAAAKNFIRVASVVDPSDYPRILEALRASGGRTSLDLRFSLAQKAFAHTAEYDRAIADYLRGQTAEAAAACYQLQNA